MSIPRFIELFIREKRWPELVFYFRHRWDREGKGCLKRQQGAVHRIKQEFIKVFEKRPFPRSTGDPVFWDQQIAKYAERLGVAALINDMRKARTENRKVFSIIYFLYSKGAACRWENLLLEKIHADALSEKKEHDEAYKLLAEALEVQGISEPVEPEWVVMARNRWHQLEQRTQILRGSKYHDALEEMREIEQRFKMHGYEVNPKKIKGD